MQLMQRHSLIENQKRALTTGPAHILSATFTLEYTFSPGASNTVVAAFEYRYDRSTGPEGGFFKGDANTLLPDQHQLIFSIMWTLGSQIRRVLPTHRALPSN